MKPLLFFIVLFTCWFTSEAQNVVLAEYFIDTDAGLGMNTLVTLPNPQPDGSYSFNVNLAGYPTGYHKLYIRTKDSDGKWSHTSRRNIEVMSSITTVQVTGGEYFFDSDPGFGEGIQFNADLPLDSIITKNILATTNNLFPGYHKLYIRTKDSKGIWGLTAKRNIEIVALITRKIITGGEYFFDSDPGFGAGTQFSADQPLDSIITKTILATTSNLSPGYHKLYIRMKDNEGKYSLTAKRNVEITQSFISLAAKAEYFFNTDPGVGNATQVVLNNPLPDGSFTFSIPFENIPDSVNTLYFRVRDSTNNRWSLTQWEKDSITTSLPSSNLWSHVETWSMHKIPDANTIVILRNYVIVDINGICKSLNVIGPVMPPPTPPLILKVNPGKILTINSQ